MDSTQSLMKPGQLALDLVLEPDYRAEAFAVSEANAAALALVNRWPRWRQGHLLLVGPAGSGKTHLSHMWTARTRATRLDPASLSNGLKTVGRGAAVLVEDMPAPSAKVGLFLTRLQRMRSLMDGQRAQSQRGGQED